MEDKLRAFVADLSDSEIETQLNDIFSWAKTYQTILEEEMHERQRINNTTPVTTLQDVFSASTPSGIAEEDVSLNYIVVTQIQNSVSTLNEADAKSRLKYLQSCITNVDDLYERTKMEFEIEMLELHLYDLTGIEPSGSKASCIFCGCEVEDDAVFCSNCGKKII